MKSSRPLSPHLQVYKMPLSAKLSIFHRLTGLALSLAAVVLVYWLYTLAYDSDNAILLQLYFSSTIGKVALIGFTFAFFYHFCNGIRHLFWDAGKGLEIATVNKSGILAIIMAVILTTITWVLGA
ncbi:MAG: succinate dehydrogenase, cytochrome b556 subunit [Marinicellaceae bacterium]